MTTILPANIARTLKLFIVMPALTLALSGCLSGASKIYQVSTVSLPKEKVPPKLSNRDESVMVYSEWFARTYGFPLSGVDRTLPQGVEALELQVVVNHNDPLLVNKAYGYDVGTCYFNLMLKNIAPKRSDYQSPPNSDRWYKRYRKRIPPFKGMFPTVPEKYAFTAGLGVNYSERRLGTGLPTFYAASNNSYLMSTALTRGYCKRLAVSYSKHESVYIDTHIEDGDTQNKIQIYTPQSFGNFLTNRFIKN